MWETLYPSSGISWRSRRIRVDFPAPDGADTTSTSPWDTGYSHSMVAGGFEEMSYTTRFTPSTSLMIRFEIRPKTS